MAAGAKILSRTVSFVRLSTPHIDGTSRRIFYSVLLYHT